MSSHNHEIYHIAMMHGGLKYFSRHYDFAYMIDGSVYELFCDDSWHCVVSSPCGMAY